MNKMPSLGEIVVKLARESERQKLEIARLKQRIRELERELAKKAN